MMKRIYLIAILVCSLHVNILSAQGQTPTNELNLKQIEKSVCPTFDLLYACKYEVSNSLYRTFEQDLLNNNQTKLLQIALVDSSVWTAANNNEPLVRYYHKHPMYENYPVIGVSYEAANLFCKWLTEKYNSNSKRKYKKVLFRLPTEKEWELAANCGIKYRPYPWGYKLRPDDLYMCNYHHIGDEYIIYDTLSQKIKIDFSRDILGHNISENNAITITENVESYFPNNFGLYNVCGNVAEMVQEKGIARGGSWKNTGGDVQLTSRSKYSKPTNDLGFRYFMEVIEK